MQGEYQEPSNALRCAPRIMASDESRLKHLEMNRRLSLCQLSSSYLHIIYLSKSEQHEAEAEEAVATFILCTRKENTVHRCSFLKR